MNSPGLLNSIQYPFVAKNNRAFGVIAGFTSSARSLTTAKSDTSSPSDTQ